MKKEWILNKVEELYENKNDKSFYCYNSLIEETIKLAIEIKNSNKPIIIVKENSYLANQFYDSLSSFFDENEIVGFFPEESLRTEEIASSYENRANRLLALFNIIKNNKIKAVITTAYGIIRNLPNVNLLKDSIFSLKKGSKITKEELINKIQYLGYEKVNKVEIPMTYASRGYIVDLYSVNYINPIRIEFFDDYIDSIRFFDINEQTTKEIVDSVEISFAKDVFFTDEDKKYLMSNVNIISGEIELELEYIQKNIYKSTQYIYSSYFNNMHLCDYLEFSNIYISDISRINDHLDYLRNETISYIQEMYSEKKIPLKFGVYGDFKQIIDSHYTIYAKPYGEINSKIIEVDLPNGNIEYLLSLIKANKNEYKLFFLDKKNAEKYINVLTNLNIKYSIFNNKLQKGINVIFEELNCGFEISELNLVAYSSFDLLKEKKHFGKFSNKFSEATSINSFEDLKKGDYVVHDQYGIGQYIDIETKNVNGISSDYLKIIYKGNDELLVPLSQFSLVRKYVSKDGVIPKLHKLGTKEWIETKKKVESNLEELAGRLLDLYATREDAIGFAYGKDDEMQKEFEDDFNYELTSDQKIAIDEVKKDMENNKPMDRLLCGDVGFGKTEVALRASFKAVNNEKQVAYLCPTTILAMQHFKTYKMRFEKYPMRVELLSRFIPEKKQNEIINDLKNGKVDILIGTHRILSRDIEYKDLGLLIIDEEQRFGVEHKERIKEYKNTIDVLSLSATPIPRTLQMSLIGIRGLSLLNTPPLNRYPVQTYIVHKNDNLIREAIIRELERKGQVFYLFNNVELIYSVANKIKNTLPFATVEVAHGKMSSEEIENIMYRFYQNEIQVLICTTIVETGIDIPNANTIIVDNAQNFGLSQLYQIKGRVGRSDRIAYAYFMIPNKKQLNEVAEKRLRAIKEFASLGSGYKIAMRDLTIRGAGDLLGPKQSGFIDNVGLDLYLSMLNRAIKIKKGEKVEENKEKNIVNIPLASYIPNSFDDNDYQKLSIYHELDKIDNKKDLLKYYLKIEDEYGKLPKVVKTLFEKKKLELLFNMHDIEKITNKNNKFRIILTEECSNSIDGVKMFEYCNELSKDIDIEYKDSKLQVFVEAQNDAIDKVLILVDNLDKLKKNEN